MLLEWENYVLSAEDPKHEDLVHRRLLKIAGQAVVTAVTGPLIPGGSSVTLISDDLAPNWITMEWSNPLAKVLRHQGVYDLLTTGRSSDCALKFEL